MCGNRTESAIRDFDLRGDPQIQTWGEGLLILLAADQTNNLPQQMDALKLTELHRLVRMPFAQDPKNTRESADCYAHRGLKIALWPIIGDRIRTAKYVGVKPST
ncbi:unnamed protein product [Clonostachys chloroleuca]|uniref:Uncharacterized protein n=1 Tax=Clonostachys chloroleuca TaxID=1926264 RepID=A0AA35QFH8_9HYPO|nr:unnamed protein product [Clonostachys chloroleuca]